MVQENEKLSKLLERIQVACNASTAFAGSDCGPGWRGRIRLGDVRDLFVDFKCYILEQVSKLYLMVWDDLIIGRSGECRIACQGLWMIKEAGFLLFRASKFIFQIIRSIVPWRIVFSLKATAWIWLMLYFLVAGTTYLVFLYLWTLMNIMKKVVLALLYLIPFYWCWWVVRRIYQYKNGKRDKIARRQGLKFPKRIPKRVYVMRKVVNVPKGIQEVK